MGPILKRTDCVGKLVNILHYTCGIFGTKVSRTGHHIRSSDIPFRRRHIGSSDIPLPLDFVKTSKKLRVVYQFFQNSSRQFLTSFLKMAAGP